MGHARRAEGRGPEVPSRRAQRGPQRRSKKCSEKKEHAQYFGMIPRSTHRALRSARPLSTRAAEKLDAQRARAAALRVRGAAVTLAGGRFACGRRVMGGRRPPLSCEG